MDDYWILYECMHAFIQGGNRQGGRFKQKTFTQISLNNGIHLETRAFMPHSQVDRLCMWWWWLNIFQLISIPWGLYGKLVIHPLLTAV